MNEILEQTPTAVAEFRELQVAIRRRRTFAIISHPDAGKTTLTEQLLVGAGALAAAGLVRPKKNRSYAASDWMAMEQARGISITSTALQFEYGGALFNLLDTPGHEDFSEDTYRTLMAVDSAVMVLDAAKGIEPRTLKLFEVCRTRGLPILTFINKIDQPGRSPLELIDEIEKTLVIEACPMQWPVGNGAALKGIVSLNDEMFHEYERYSQRHGEDAEPVPWDSDSTRAHVGQDFLGEAQGEMALLSEASPRFDQSRFLKGEQTPVYFGSALHNFGVKAFLDELLRLAPQPQPRSTVNESVAIDPLGSVFSAFVFKIQGNMDPQHRDNMAFLRVCSGKFERDALVYHPRLGRRIRMTRMHRIFARDRTLMDEAYAGDVVGVVNPGLFRIGDTLASEEGIEYPRIPSFEPEFFCTLSCQDVSRTKQFRKGLEQLSAEGVVQVYYSVSAARREPILGAVGRLQFDVVESRMLQEYGAKVRMEPMSFSCARWMKADPDAMDSIRWPSRGIEVCRDHEGHLVCLFESAWDLRMISQNHPKVIFEKTA
ncbi:MAG: peptide chain release factor 3 [Bryobacterales bacterium]|nr:peptide chain release factor 3 [Bryobacterales bacterium]